MTFSDYAPNGQLATSNRQLNITNSLTAKKILSTGEFGKFKETFYDEKFYYGLAYFFRAMRLSQGDRIAE